MKRTLLLFILIFTSFLGFCQNSELFYEYGFVIYNEIPYINIYPVKNMDLENPLSSIFTKNFKKGFQFNFYDGYIELTNKKVFERILPNKGLDSLCYKMYFIPVKVSYKLFPKNIDYPSKIKNDYIFNLNNKKIFIRLKTDYCMEIKIDKIEYLNW